MYRRVAGLAALAVTAVVTVTGCSHTVTGTAQRAHLDGHDPYRDYGYVDDRCGLLLDSSIQQILGADHLVRPYSGAVCQYVLSRKAPQGALGAGVLDVIFSWFETGTLARERAVAQERGAQITDTIIERHEGFLARRDVTGAACSATTAAGSGVLSWWVQFRGDNSGDPCEEARLLLSKTLRSEL